jgi:DNA-binding transcriptional regulator YiaG
LTGPELHTARKALGHTQHSLAVALRMGKHGWQTISGWENGHTPIPGPVQVALEHLRTVQEKGGER